MLDEGSDVGALLANTDLARLSTDNVIQPIDAGLPLLPAAGQFEVSPDSRLTVADLWVGGIEDGGAGVPDLGIDDTTLSPGFVTGDPLFRPLTIEDMITSTGTGRYGDSTEDYAWNELSTGDFEWAANAFKSEAKNDIKLIVQTSTSVGEAEQRVQQYLVDHGLTNAVQIYNPATWGVDAVVTGHRLPLPPIFNFDLMGGFASWSGNDGTSVQTTTPLNADSIPDTNPDGPDVAVEILNSVNAAEVYMAADILKAGIEALDAKFHNMLDTDIIYSKNGEPVTGAQLKAWWNSLDFRVTDREFATGAGAVVNGISNINFGAVIGWDQSDPNGLSFIILHELTHSSPGGVLSTVSSWDMHRILGGSAVDYDENAFWFDVNEEYANWGARAIMTLLEIPIPTDLPAFGYDDTMTPAPPHPPSPPPGGGGSGGGGGTGGGGTGGGGGGNVNE